MKIRKLKKKQFDSFEFFTDQIKTLIKAKMVFQKSKFIIQIRLAQTKIERTPSAKTLSKIPLLTSKPAKIRIAKWIGRDAAALQPFPVFKWRWRLDNTSKAPLH